MSKSKEELMKEKEELMKRLGKVEKKEEPVNVKAEASYNDETEALKSLETLVTNAGMDFEEFKNMPPEEGEKKILQAILNENKPADEKKGYDAPAVVKNDAELYEAYTKVLDHLKGYDILNDLTVERNIERADEKLHAVLMKYYKNDNAALAKDVRKTLGVKIDAIGMVLDSTWTAADSARMLGKGGKKGMYMLGDLTKCLCEWTGDRIEDLGEFVGHSIDEATGGRPEHLKDVNLLEEKAKAIWAKFQKVNPKKK